VNLKAARTGGCVRGKRRSQPHIFYHFLCPTCYVVTLRIKGTRHSCPELSAQRTAEGGGFLMLGPRRS
jgi:hypothetical protein